MPPTTYKDGKPTKGFTQIPNDILDDSKLCLRDKAVLCVLLRHAYGKKTTAYPSQVRIAKLLGIDRRTTRSALKSLQSTGYIEAIDTDGRGKVKYKLHLPPRRDLSIQCPGNLSIECTRPEQSVLTKHTAQENEYNNTLAPPSASVVRGSVEPGVSNGNNDTGKCSAYKGPEHSVPRFSKGDINELLLDPEGMRPESDPDGISCNLNEALVMAESPVHFNSAELDKLVAKHGSKYVARNVSMGLRPPGARKS